MKAILAIAFCCPLLSYFNENVRAFETSFGPIEEFFAKSASYAMSHSKDEPGLSPWVPECLLLYQESEPGTPLGSVRLALKLGVHWLIVGEAGRATLGSKPGRFDVVGWEKLVRRRKPSGIRPGPLVRMLVSNETSMTISMRDSAGFVRGDFPPHSRTAVTTWYAHHDLLAGRTRLASFNRLLSRVVRVAPIGIRLTPTKLPNEFVLYIGPK